MTAKEYLESVRIQERKVNLMRENLHKLREALGMKSVSFDSDGSVRSTRPTDKIAEAVCKVIDYESELKEEEAELAILRFNVEKAIESLENGNEREVLKRWYLLFQPVKKIMCEMGYSESRIFVFRREGIKKIVFPKHDSKKQ